MTSWKVLAVVGGLAAAAVACSSSSSGGGGGGGSSDGCNYPKDFYCYSYSDLPSADVSAEQSACTSAMGTWGACSTSDVVGCCTETTDGYSAEECYYSGSGSPYTSSTTSTIESACKTAGGTWSSSP